MKSKRAEKWTPSPIQKEGVKRLVSNSCQGLLWKPGRRKTSTLLAAISILKQKGYINRVLVISTKRIIRFTWPEEIARWADFNHLTIDVLHGPKKDAVADSTTADILAISCDVSALSWFFHQRKLHKTLDVDMLIIDESSKFKNYSSTRFKGYPRKKGRAVAFEGIRHYIPHFKRRYIATGSPRPRSVENLFSQIYLLDEGAALGAYISHFRSKYMVQSGYGGYTWLPRPGAVEEIYRAISPLVHVVGDEDMTDMPEVVYETLKVELPPKALRIYKEIENEFITELRSGVVKAASAGVASMKCRQVANGALFYDEEKDIGHGLKIKGARKYEELHTEKLQALQDLIEELDGEQLFICYDFQHDKERILATLGVGNVGVLGVSDRQDETVKDAWNAGVQQLILGHPASVGHGLNMQLSGAFNICFFGQLWDWELVFQTLRRLARSGNRSKHVFAWFITAADTVDEDIVAAIIQRRDEENGFFTTLSDYTARRAGITLMPTPEEFKKIVSTALERNKDPAYSEEMLLTYIRCHLKNGTLRPDEVQRYVEGWFRAEEVIRNGGVSSKRYKEKSTAFLCSVVNLPGFNQTPTQNEERPMKAKSAKDKAVKVEKPVRAPRGKKAVAAAEPVSTPAKKGRGKKAVAAEPAPVSTKSRSALFSEDMKISVLVGDNPKREGSAAYEMFALYKGCKTVADYLTAGGTRDSLRYDVNKGFISVE